MLLRSLYIISCFVFASTLMGQKQFKRLLSLYFFLYISSTSLFGSSVLDTMPTSIKNKLWNSGTPFIQTFVAEDYGSTDNQVWSFSQDSLGRIYAGTGQELLMYNGAQWTKHSIPNQVVLSMSKFKSDRVYIGGEDEIGFAELNGPSGLIYTSLTNQLDSADQTFGEVWQTFAIEENVYFIASKQIMIWDQQEFNIWKPTLDLGWSFKLHNKIYFFADVDKCYTIEGKTISLSPISEHINNLGGYSVMLQGKDSSILLGQFGDGLFSLNDEGIQDLNFSADNNVTLYGGLSINDTTHVVGSLGQGVFIINNQGDILSHYNAENDLSSNSIYTLFIDMNGNLWTGGSSGINYLEINSPFRILDKTFEMSGLSKSVAWNNGVLYIATDENLYSSNFNQVLSFDKEDFTSNVVGNLVEIEKGLLGTHLDYPFLINKNNVIQKIPTPKGSPKAILPINKNFFLVGDGGGDIYLGDLETKKYRTILNVSSSVNDLFIQQNNRLWISTRTNGLFSLSDVNNYLENSDSVKTNLAKYSTEVTASSFFTEIDNKLYLGDHTGLSVYNTRNDNFENVNYLFDIPDSIFTCYPIKGRIKGYFRTMSSQGSQMYFLKEGKMQIAHELERLKDQIYSNFTFLDEDFAFHLGKKNIIYVPNHSRKSTRASVNINQYKINLGQYSIDSTITVLGADDNSIRLEFGVPNYVSSEHNLYQSRLNGFEKDWTDWTPETWKDYTQLPPGTYDFQVNAKDIYGNIYQQDEPITIKISPKWFQTWWMTVLYFLCAGFVLYGFLKWRSRELLRKNLRLEEEISNRTVELNDKNILLEKQSKKLKELDEIKNQFFANISHEFRTPLTLIKGPIEQLEKNPNDQLSVTNVKMIRRNANRLLRLVNQLLDISKLDAQKLKLEVSEGNIFNCLRAAASSFSSHAAQRNMDYKVDIPSRKLWASFDRDKLEKIIYNLLSNAFKYTPDEGQIMMSAHHQDDLLKIKVIDSGVGISQTKQLVIFDRFYQVDQSQTRSEGTGIGLALTKELVELMHGSIDVDSSLENGSSFIIKIPLEAIKSEVDQYIYKQPNEQAPGMSHAYTESEQPADKPLVLIIEDNVDMRQYIRQHLARSYSVIEAYNGKTGLEKARRIIPDLIVTDLMMPQMDGMALSEKLRQSEITSHIPIIMLTAKAGFSSKILGLEKGADIYLTKPFELEELKVQIKKLITQRKKLRARYSQQTKTDPKNISITSVDEQFFKKIMALLESEHMNGLFGIPDMQEKLGMSKTQLHRKIKAITDLAPGELLRNYRIRRAEQLLRQRADSVSQIAFMVGFNNPSHFAQSFKKYYGVSPTEYLKQL